MATSTRTRRKASDTPAAAPADQAADASAVAPAPAPARRAAAAKRTRAAADAAAPAPQAAPAAAPPAAEDTPAAVAPRPARKAAASKTAVAAAKTDKPSRTDKTVKSTKSAGQAEPASPRGAKPVATKVATAVAEPAAQPATPRAGKTAAKAPKAARAAATPATEPVAPAAAAPTPEPAPAEAPMPAPTAARAPAKKAAAKKAAVKTAAKTGAAKKGAKASPARKPAAKAAPPADLPTDSPVGVAPAPTDDPTAAALPVAEAAVAAGPAAAPATPDPASEAAPPAAPEAEVIAEAAEPPQVLTAETGDAAAAAPVDAVSDAEANDDDADDGSRDTPDPTDAGTGTSAGASSRSRRNRNRRRRGARPADPQAQATAEAVLAVLAAAAPTASGAIDATPAAADTPAAPSPDTPPTAVATDDRGPLDADADTTAQPAAEPAPAPAVPPTGPAHSRIACLPGDATRIAWQPGHACPPALRQAAQRRVDDLGHLSPEDDAALPLLLRLAQEGGHTLLVDAEVWPLLAAHRDARHRLSALEAAYPDGPASPALQRLLRVPLPLFQAEGALFAVIAGRALIADERGLGKGVQAIAAARLWQRHFGVQRVLVLCAPAQRAAWQRAWQRLAGGDDSQIIDGGHHQRPAQWAAAAGVRILAPEALQTDAAHLAHWAPDLVIVDEPQQLGLQAADWAALQDVPQALVLSGAPLADLPALTDTLVAWLDTARLGPLAALRELQAASRGERTLDEADVERLSASLSRLMLQRQRDDVADQLPPVVHSERLLPLAPGQRAAHDRHAATARRLLAGWQASGWCSDTDQWRLAQALHGMQQACHRADPADPASALAEATVQALAGTLAELAQLGTGGGDGGADGAPQVAVLCATAADQVQLAERLAEFTGGDRPVRLLAPGEPLPGGIDVVLQAGVPWRVRRQPGGPRGEAPAGQQWISLVAQDGIDGGLFDTLAARLDAPRGPGSTDGGGGARGYLQGDALQQWLGLLQAALVATPAAAG